MPTAFSGLIHPWHPLLLIGTLNTYIHVSPPPPPQIHKQQSWKNCCAVQLEVPTTGEMSCMFISIHSQIFQPSPLARVEIRFLYPLWSQTEIASCLDLRLFCQDANSRCLELCQAYSSLVHPTSKFIFVLKPNVLIHAASVLSVTFRGLNVLIHAANVPVLSGSVTSGVLRFISFSIKLPSF